MTHPVTFHVLGGENAHLLAGTGVFDHPIKPEQLGAFLADPGHHLVFAQCEAQIIGIGSATILLHPDKEPMLFINEVGVEEEFQRQGVASRICEMLIELARDQGCKGIWLATEGDNAPAQALYKKLGAREWKDIIVYDWDEAMDM